MATQYCETALPSAEPHHALDSSPRLFDGWINSEVDLLTEVLLGSPKHLSLIPCNAVSRAALCAGLTTSASRAEEQHGALVRMLSALGVKVRKVPPVTGLPDLAFTRDSSFMTPWGLLGMRPGAAHRRGEVDAVIAAAAAAGIPVVGRVRRGRVEGGDVCLMRPGYVAIGISGERTDQEGAQAVGAVFARNGWKAIYTRIQPELLHLDTHFCMVDRHLALGCTEKLHASFMAEVTQLGIEILPVDADEVASLGCNILSLGGRRIVSAGGAPRVDELLSRRGFEVLKVELDEFTRCGGGVHCLTMPLRRTLGL